MPAGFRPIVVDNGSTDGSGDLARSLGATVVSEPARGVGAAAQAGRLAATSDLVCFCDCDGSLDPGQFPLLTRPLLTGQADLGSAAVGRTSETPGRCLRGWPTGNWPGGSAAAPGWESATWDRCGRQAGRRCSA